MRFNRKFKLVAVVLSVVTACAIPVNAAPLPIHASAIPNKAVAGNTGEAIILVYLANEDGTPNTNAETPRQGADPNGGVELKGSKWSFETISVPSPYSGRAWADYGQTRQVDLFGQLRIMQVNPFVNQQVAVAGFY